MSDTAHLQKALIGDIKDQAIRHYRRALFFSIGAIIFLALTFGAGFIYNYVRSNAMIEGNYRSLLAGVYSIQAVTSDEITPREKRVEAYMKKAKKIVLAHNPHTDMGDAQLNDFLRVNWELSEYYMWSPYMALAYAAEESDFNRGAVSFAGARGILQWFPFSMREVLGDLYVPGMEGDPVWSLKAWYRRTSIGAEVMDHDFIWTACYYILPNAAVIARKSGKTPQAFMKWLVAMYPGNDGQYPWKIKAYFDQYSGE